MRSITTYFCWPVAGSRAAWQPVSFSLPAPWGEGQGLCQLGETKEDPISLHLHQAPSSWRWDCGVYVYLVIQSCLTLWDRCFGTAWTKPTRRLCPWDFPGKNTQWVAIPFSRGSSQPKGQTQVSCISCIGKWVLLPLSYLEAHTLP